MKFYFCESCNKRITEADLAQGEGKNKKLKGVFCKKCAVGVLTVEYSAMSDAEAQKILEVPKQETLTGKGKAAPRSKLDVRNRKSKGRAEEIQSRPKGISPLWAGLAIAGVGLMGAVLLVLFLTPSKAPPKKPRTVKRSTRDLSEHTEDPSRQTPKPFPTAPSDDGPSKRTVGLPEQTAKPLSTQSSESTSPAKDLEGEARSAFEKLKAFEGLAADDLEGRIGHLDDFLKQFTGTLAERQARSLHEKLVAEKKVLDEIARSKRVVLQFGVSPSPAFQDMQDTTLFGKRGRQPTIYSYQGSEPLAIRFGLNRVPKGAHIVKATLSLYGVKIGYPSPGGVTSIYPLAEEWSEYEASTSHRKNGIPWSKGKGTIEETRDWGAGKLGVVTRRTMVDKDKKMILEDGWAAFDLTPLVQAWVSGTLPNYGITFRNTADFIITWHSKESLERLKRPKLEILFGDASEASLVGAGHDPSDGKAGGVEAKLAELTEKFMTLLVDRNFGEAETLIRKGLEDDALKDHEPQLTSQLEALAWLTTWKDLVARGAAKLTDGRPFLLQTANDKIQLGSGQADRVTKFEKDVLHVEHAEKQVSFQKRIKLDELTCETGARLAALNPDPNKEYEPQALLVGLIDAARPRKDSAASLRLLRDLQKKLALYLKGAGEASGAQAFLQTRQAWLERKINWFEAAEGWQAVLKLKATKRRSLHKALKGWLEKFGKTEFFKEHQSEIEETSQSVGSDQKRKRIQKTGQLMLQMLFDSPAARKKISPIDKNVSLEVLGGAFEANGRSKGCFRTRAKKNFGSGIKLAFKKGLPDQGATIAFWVKPQNKYEVPLLVIPGLANWVIKAIGNKVAGKGDGKETWMHIAVVYAKTHFRIFVNGIQIEEKETKIELSRIREMSMGARMVGDSTKTIFQFSGQFDSLRIWWGQVTEFDLEQP